MLSFVCIGGLWGCMYLCWRMCVRAVQVPKCVLVLIIPSWGVIVVVASMAFGSIDSSLACLQVRDGMFRLQSPPSWQSHQHSQLVLPNTLPAAMCVVTPTPIHPMHRSTHAHCFLRESIPPRCLIACLVLGHAYVLLCPLPC